MNNRLGVFRGQGRSFGVGEEVGNSELRGADWMGEVYVEGRVAFVIKRWRLAYVIPEIREWLSILVSIVRKESIHKYL